MEDPLPQTGPDSGLGAWHPALRPDSVTRDQEEPEYRQSRSESARFVDTEEKSGTLGSPHLSLSPLPGKATSQTTVNIAPAGSESFTKGARKGLAESVDGEEKRHGIPQHTSPTDAEYLEHSNATGFRTGNGSGQTTDDSEDAPGFQAVQNVNGLVIDDLEPEEGAGDSTTTNSTFSRPPPVRETQSPKFMWREDEQMDPAWGFKGMDTEEGSSGILNNTSSFPQVPPMVKRDAMPPIHQLPNSQAEEIMEIVNQREDLKASLLEEDDDHDRGHSGWLEPLMQATTLDPTGHEFFNSAENGLGMNSSELDDEQARFEEGLPLMSAELDNPQPDSPHHDAAEGESTSIPGTNPITGSFVHDLENEAVEDSSPVRLYILDRKSTNQVINSLQYSSPYGSDNSTKPQDSKPNAKDSDLLDSPFAGRIDITRSNAEQHSAQQATTANGASKPSMGNEDNLDAMWKAALADDELLDEVEPSVDPSSFFAEDGEGFLDTSDEKAPAKLSVYEKPLSQQSVNNITNSFDHYTQNPRGGNLEYTNATPDQRQHRESRSTPSVSTSYGLQYADGNVAVSRPGIPEKAQSFADKSKGGYTSPYDIPIDVSRLVKRRSNLSQAQHLSSSRSITGPPPPPRISSMNSNVNSYAQQNVGSQPPTSSQYSQLPSVHSPGFQAPREVAPTLRAKPSTGSFFEELPVTAKPRPSSSGGRYTPQLHQPSFPSQMPPPPPSVQNPIGPSQASSSPNPSLSYQLVPPERIGAYSNVSEQPPLSQAVPLKSRYSPAPPPQSGTAPSRNRYATPPANANRPPQAQILPFQPRTSSPLAQNTTILHQNQQAHHPSIGHVQPQQESQKGDPSNQSIPFDVPSTGLYIQNPLDNRPIKNYNPPAPNHIDYLPNHVQKHDVLGAANNFDIPSRKSTSISPSASGGNEIVPPKQAFPQRQAPDQIKASIANASFEPPRRSQTHSPGVVGSRPDLPFKAPDPFPRPASANDPNSPTLPDPTFATTNKYSSGHSRGYSHVVNYIRPTDGRENDPLERWKGCPIFNFGSGGNIVTSFPKQSSRFGGGQALPMIKCGPGEVKIQTGKLLPFDEDSASFPGPLRSKSKKKDILEWLKKKIDHLATQIPDSHSQALPDLRKCHEEKVILWRIMLVLIEHDGVIEGNSAAETAVKIVLSPELAVGNLEGNMVYGAHTELVGISRSNGSQPTRSSNQVEPLEDLRRMLLKTEREKAVWHAADKGLWAHAMLIASTLPKTVSMQVVHEFVRQEVRSVGDNTESLSALFEIFGGNLEQSIDQLVPPSARAGLQMVSKAAGTGPTKNALDGLDRWRETLTLVLSNRSQDDGIALIALGRLLSDFGRIEAAHTCYIFAKKPSLFGGPDDLQVGVALLGASHLQKPFDYGRDLDSILLTEIYEFATGTLAPAASASMTPHLQAYKLCHAMVLAEHGHFHEAQQYCDSITSAAKATTKLSPYYHSLLFGTLEEFVGRLRQAPREGSGSWITKPSMDKVSGSIWTAINSFVTGDESDTASTGSGKAHENDTVAFANAAGDPYAVNRVPSVTDSYSAYSGGGASTSIPPRNAAQSRYAPSGQYTPRSSLEQQDRLSLDSQRPMQYGGLRPPTMQRQYSNQSYTSSTELHSEGPQDSYKPIAQPSSYTPLSGSYLPTPPAQPDNPPQVPVEDNSYSQSSYQSTPLSVYQPVQEPYQPAHNPELPQSYEPTTSGYEPPSTDSYIPPLYEPTSEETPQSPMDGKPKKKSFMDDDDDDFTIRTDSAIKDKARKDREAEENFRKAAEADGKPSRSISYKSCVN